MNQNTYRPAKIEINLTAIKSNISQLKQELNTGVDIIAVVKANGYGHGAIEVAKSALEAGATSLAVALLEEAVELRKAGIDAPILVLGWVDPAFVDVAIAHDLTLTVFQESWLDAYLEQEPSSEKLSIHVKIDTGMGRIGLRTVDELNGFIDKLLRTDLKVTGVYTHFATADEENTDYYHLQLRRLEPMLDQIKNRIQNDFIVHIGNSAAALRQDRKSTRLNSSHVAISYAVFCLKKKKRYTLIILQPNLHHFNATPTNERTSIRQTILIHLTSFQPFCHHI